MIHKKRDIQKYIFFVRRSCSASPSSLVDIQRERKNHIIRKYLYSHAACMIISRIIQHRLKLTFDFAVCSRIIWQTVTNDSPVATHFTGGLITVTRTFGTSSHWFGLVVVQVLVEARSAWFTRRTTISWWTPAHFHIGSSWLAGVRVHGCIESNVAEVSG